jgi:hypothetical protein
MKRFASDSIALLLGGLALILGVLTLSAEILTIYLVHILRPEVPSNLDWWGRFGLNEFPINFFLSWVSVLAVLLTLLVIVLGVLLIRAYFQAKQ